MNLRQLKQNLINQNKKTIESISCPSWFNFTGLSCEMCGLALQNQSFSIDPCSAFLAIVFLEFRKLWWIKPIADHKTVTSFSANLALKIAEELLHYHWPGHPRFSIIHHKSYHNSAVKRSILEYFLARKDKIREFVFSIISLIVT